MKQVILITGASSGFGELAAKALAQAGYTVYASMRDTAGKKPSHPTRTGRDVLVQSISALGRFKWIPHPQRSRQKP